MLLNQETKVFRAAIANRLYISNHFSKDQMGFISHQNMAGNIRKTLDIILLGKTEPYESILVALDI